MIRAMIATVLLVLVSSPVQADEATAPRVWSDTAEVAFVLTSGNTATFSLGVKNTLEGKWPRQSIAIRLAVLRAEDTETTRFAVGGTDDFEVESSEITDVKDESYEFGTRFDRKLSDRHAWFVDGSWLRNEFSGISSRAVGLFGLATTWKDGERVHFRTDVALSWTNQEEMVDDPSQADSWLGLRLGSKFSTKVGTHGEYGNDLAIDINLDETDDLRIDMSNWFAVSFTERLALKLSHRLNWDNQPALELIDLFDAADLTTPIDSVPVELEHADTHFSAVLVVGW